MPFPSPFPPLPFPPPPPVPVTVTAMLTAADKLARRSAVALREPQSVNRPAPAEMPRTVTVEPAMLT